MAEKMYTIGEVHTITGISKDTLRFYDKVGLFKPNHIDPSNNYRYYTYDQFWQLDIIACCRKLNISIKTIQDILKSEDNNKVVALLKEHQKEALQLSEYYKQVADDIEWYSQKSEKIKNTKRWTSVRLKHFPAKSVICGKNENDTKAYHLKLQETCRKLTNHGDTLRRNYGFILNPAGLKEGIFEKEGEYIEFFEDFGTEIDPSHLLEIPAGEYACCVVNAKNHKADFSVLNRWLEEHQITPEFVVANEVGLQLFEYLDHEHPCEVRVLVGP